MKKLVYIMIFIFSLFLLGGCISDGSAAKRVAEVLNDNTNLELKLLQDMSIDTNLDNYVHSSGMGVYSLCHKKYLLEDESEANYQDQLFNGTILFYEVTAWPDYYKGGSYITRIYCSDHSVMIFDISLESSIEEVKEVLTTESYQYSSEKNGEYEKHSFKNQGINIVFFEKDDALVYFTLSATVTNIYKVQY